MTIQQIDDRLDEITERFCTARKTRQRLFESSPEAKRLLAEFDRLEAEKDSRAVLDDSDCVLGYR